MKRVLVAGIVGGFVAFLWMCISWGMLPWHQVGITKFENEEAVASVISENAPESGVYLLPYVALESLQSSIEEDKEVYQEQKKAIHDNPMIFAQINRHGIRDYSPLTYIWNILSLCVCVSFVAYLLTLLKLDTTYFKRFYFCVIFGLSTSIFAQLPGWVWFGASGSYVGIMIIDTVITWALVGLVLASIVKPKFQLKQMM